MLGQEQEERNKTDESIPARHPVCNLESYKRKEIHCIEIPYV